MRLLRSIAIGAALSMALCSCDKGEGGPKRDSVAKGGQPMLVNAGDAVTYAVGNPNFRGRTTVKVTHDGSETVTSERAGKTDRYVGKLGADALAKLRATLSENDPRGFSSKRTTAQPDEARIEIGLVTGGTKTNHAFWDAEQHKVPALRKLVAVFNEVATTISKGKLTY